MRKEKEVKAKFDDLYNRRLAKRKEQFLSKYYRNCYYNTRLRVKGNGKCGFCCHPKVLHEQGNPYICDEDGIANKCKYFYCRNTPESVEKDFEEILQSPARCGNEYPKLAILIWFLHDKTRRSRWSRFKTSFADFFISLYNLMLWRWW